jgi:hypothetical protein
MTPGAARILTSALGAIVVVAVLLLPAASATPVGLAPSAASATTSVQEWGYGGSRWANTSGLTVNGSLYDIHAFLGVQVVVREVNTSATTFELTANRTMVLDYFALYCRPSCGTSTSTTANISVRMWEVAHVADNFSTAGTVVGPSGPVPAIALLNSSVSDAENLTAVGSVVIPIHNGGTLQGSTDLTVHSHAAASVVLTPGLGIVPENLSATSSWTSASAFAAQGDWSWGLDYSHVPLLGAAVHTAANDSGAVAQSGNLTLSGTDLGSISLRGGLTASAVRISIAGPFAFRDGLVLVPTSADLFGASGTLQQRSPAGQSASTSAVDFAAGGGSRLLLRASETTFAGTSAEPEDTDALQTMDAQSNTSASGSVQAEPETAATANTQSICMLSGTCTTTPPGGPQSPARLGGALVLAVAVVGLTVIVVGLVVARQPPRKDPPSPNAKLYPPGTVAPPAGRPAAPVPPTPAEDPLGHLW